MDLSDEPQPRLYTDLADWFHLLTAPEDYEEEAAFHWRTLVAAHGSPPRTLLELGSGGGNNASHLKAHARLTLVDRSPEMLRQSRGLNPECEHVVGDMRTVRLDRTFDAVFVHDAVSYLTTVEDLRLAMETAFVHLEPGGAALFVPDHVLETFGPSTEHGGHDAHDADVGLRYLAWTRDPDPTDTAYVEDFAYLLREGSEVRAVHDRHVCGVFPRATWIELLERTGFEPRVIDADYEGGGEAFVATR